MRKKVTCGVLSALLLMLVSTTAFALDTRASSRIMSYSAESRVGSDGNLNIFFSITASSTMDVIGASRIDVQRYSGSRWVTECAITVKDEPEMQTSDAPIYSDSDYRAIVTVYAKDSSGFSTAQVTTK